MPVEEWRQDVGFSRRVFNDDAGSALVAQTLRD
jgi:hypothetical protein